MVSNVNRQMNGSPVATVGGDVRAVLGSRVAFELYEGYTGVILGLYIGAMLGLY